MRDTGGKDGKDGKEDIEMKDKEDKMDKMDKMDKKDKEDKMDKMDKMDKVEDQDEDQYLSAVGNIGKWQLRSILTLGIFCIPVAFHVLIMTFMNAKVESWCARPAHLSSLNLSTWRIVSGQVNQSCQIINNTWSLFSLTDLENLAVSPNEENSLIDCTEWEYDTSQFTSTITGEFNLVCSREYLVSTAQTLYFIGMIFGVFTFGVLADFIGRKTVMIPLLMLVGVTGIGTAMAPTFELFMAGRMINAFFLIGIWETQFTYSIELVGGRWSTIVGMGMEYFWVTGWLIMAVLGYLIRSWRTLMLSASIPMLPAFLLFWLVDESPRWLISRDKIKKAEDIIRGLCKTNSNVLDSSWTLKPVKKKNEDEEEKRKTNILDLFRTPNMRIKTFIIWYNFFVNAFVYYGLTLNSGDLGGGDVFLSFTISGLLEIPAYGLAIIVLLKYGRRFPYSGSLVLSGIFLICISLVPKGVYQDDWPAMALAQLGKFCITFAFGALFVYSAELVPTVIRTGTIGSASFIGRLGGIIAPWVGGLSSVHPHLPVWIFGTNAILAGLWAFCLPETAGKPLAYTIQESEKLAVHLPCRNRKISSENI